MSEQDLTKAIRDTLRALGCWCEGLSSRRTGYARASSALGKGAPDLIALYRGKVFAIECKNTHSQNCKCNSCATQLEWGSHWTTAGGIYILARTVDDAVTIVRRLVA